MNNNSFFSKYPLSYNIDFSKLDLTGATQEQKRWAVLRYLLQFPKKTKYFVSKQLKLSYASIHQIFRELEFSRVIVSEKLQTENGEMHDHYYIPDFQNALQMNNESVSNSDPSDKQKLGNDFKTALHLLRDEEEAKE